MKILPIEMNAVLMSSLNNAVYYLREKLSVDQNFKQELIIDIFLQKMRRNKYSG